jgi:hypothetical protein
MHGSPWGVLTDWLRYDVEERAGRYGDTRLIEDLPLARAATPDAPAEVLTLPGCLDCDDTAAAPTAA